MKRLTLALVALLLATASIAAPGGWTDNAGMHRNNAVAADQWAIHRGGSLDLNTVTLQQYLIPWTDADADHLTIDFILPGALVNIVETPVGWEGDVAGSAWRAGVADLEGVKGLGRLDDALLEFTVPGSQAYVRIPIGEVPASGEWRPVQKQLGGDWQDFDFLVQPVVWPQELLDRGAEPPDWVLGSVAIYHGSKKNDIVGTGNYMTGKAGHLAAPVAVGFRSNDTTITGWTYGWYEFDDVTGVLTKVFDAAVISGWSAQTATVVVDATIGYTSAGATRIGLGQPFTFGKANSDWLQASQEWELVSMSQYQDTASSAGTSQQAVHIATGDDTFTYVTDSTSTQIAVNIPQATPEWTTQTPTSGTPVIPSGSEFTATVRSTNNSLRYYYDTAAGYPIAGQFSGMTDYNLPKIPNITDDFSVPDVVVVEGGVRYSSYVTVSAVTTKPTTTNVVVTPSETAVSTDIAVTADITSPVETITAAEYFIGVTDPGAGNGVSMSLGAGTTSRTASASGIDVGSVIGVFTFSVRGFSSEGWGVVGTDTFTVLPATPTGVSATSVSDTEIEVDFTEDVAVFQYRIYWSTSSPVTTGDASIDPLGVIPYTHTGRTTGVTYFYAVQANQGGQLSALSAEVSAEAGATPSGDYSGLNLGIGLEL